MLRQTVSVLMSTYNGEKFLREQIDSILNQKDVEVTLVIRDDGSFDSTCNIVKEYCRNNDNIVFYQGKNVGVGKSFMKLLYKAPKSDYYAFSDQDDVWMEDKISRAIDVIIEKESRNNKPILYASNQMIFDESGKTVGYRFDEMPPIDLYNCLVTFNWLNGCTMVFNADLYSFLVDRKRRPYERVIRTRIHDTWVHYVANIVGEIVYDNESRIAYRLHDNNEVGLKNDKKLKGISLIKDKYKRFTSKKRKGIRSLSARNLLNCYSDIIDNSMKRHLEILANSNSFEGGVLLCRDVVLRQEFKENSLMILLRAILGWI